MGLLYSFIDLKVDNTGLKHLSFVNQQGLPNNFIRNMYIGTIDLKNSAKFTN